MKTRQEKNLLNIPKVRAGIKHPLNIAEVTKRNKQAKIKVVDD